MTRFPPITLSEEEFEYAPNDLVHAVLRNQLRWQLATTEIERWECSRIFWEQKAALENSKPIVIRLSDGRTMGINSAVPYSRGDCPTEKPCPHVRCRYHLWRVDGGENGTRAGRPGLAAVPRNESGLTISVSGKIEGKRAGTTLEARWLETPVPQSCALDAADGGELTNEQAGAVVGRHRTLIGREVPKAKRRMVKNAERLGMTEQDLMAGLRELRRENGRG